LQSSFRAKLLYSMDPRIRMHEQLEGLLGEAVVGNASHVRSGATGGPGVVTKAKHVIEDPERAADDLESPPEVKASEAHLELMELFKEDADFKGCKLSLTLHF